MVRPGPLTRSPRSAQHEQKPLNPRPKRTGMSKTIDISDLADHRANVGKIIQETFFPPPVARWDSISDEQRQEFLECADEIFTYLRKWNKGRAP